MTLLMCGLFGYVGTSAPDLETLTLSARMAATRGPHAHGWAMSGTSLAQTIPMIQRQLGPIDDKAIDRLNDVVGRWAPTAIVGHARLATTSAHSQNDVGDVQPIRGSGFVIVHNGNVDAHPLLGDCMRTGNDSEQIALLAGNLIEACHEPGNALRAAIEGLGLKRRPHAILLMTDTGRLYAARHRLPIFRHDTPTGVHLCSRPVSGSSQLLPDNHTIEVCPA